MLQAAAKACIPLQMSSQGRSEKKPRWVSIVDLKSPTIGVTFLFPILKRLTINILFTMTKKAAVWVYQSYSTSWPHFKIIFKKKWKDKGYSYTQKKWDPLSSYTGRETGSLKPAIIAWSCHEIPCHWEMGKNR